MFVPIAPGNFLPYFSLVTTHPPPSSYKKCQDDLAKCTEKQINSQGSASNQGSSLLQSLRWDDEANTFVQDSADDAGMLNTAQNTAMESTSMQGMEEAPMSQGESQGGIESEDDADVAMLLNNIPGYGDQRTHIRVSKTDVKQFMTKYNVG